MDQPVFQPSGERQTRKKTYNEKPWAPNAQQVLPVNFAIYNS
jgi:hypothetical protein